jgi:hypothetical protein
MASLAELGRLAAHEHASADGQPAPEPDGDPDWPVAPPVVGVAAIGEVRLRHRTLVQGTVIRSAPCAWRGGMVLEADLDDGTGRLTLAFVGRVRLAGVVEGVAVRAEGTVGARQGRRLMLNPVLTLLSPDAS